MNIRYFRTDSDLQYYPVTNHYKERETLHITAQDTLTLTAPSVGLVGLVHFIALYHKFKNYRMNVCWVNEKMRRIWRE